MLLSKVEEEYVTSLETSQIYPTASAATDMVTTESYARLCWATLPATLKKEYHKRDLARYVLLTTQPSSRGMAFDGSSFAFDSDEPNAFSAPFSVSSSEKFSPNNSMVLNRRAHDLLTN
jgi:hypothetical protein